MTDISDLIKSAVTQTPSQMQNDFAELMLDKIRDVVADRKAEIAQQFIGGDQLNDEQDDLPDDQQDFEDQDDRVEQDQQDDIDGDEIEFDDLTDEELTDDDIQGDDNEDA